MANANLSNMYLLDLWPGAVNPNLSIPTGGWDNTIDNQVLKLWRIRTHRIIRVITR